MIGTGNAKKKKKNKSDSAVNKDRATKQQNAGRELIRYSGKVRKVNGMRYFAVLLPVCHLKSTQSSSQ